MGATRAKSSACAGRTVVAIGEASLIDCESCGYKHVDPMPTPEDLREMYSEQYFTKEKPDNLKFHLEDQDWWNLQYEERCRTLESLCRSAGSEPSGGGPRLLELGSGLGFFLKFACDRGWDGVGVEPSESAASYATEQGLDIIRGEFNEANLGDRVGFDIFYACNVLEHVPNPEEMLRLAYERIAPGASVCLVVPNDDNPLQSIISAGQRPHWFVPGHHLNYWDFDSFERFVASAGFEVQARQTSFPMELFVLMGDDYRNDRDLGRACHGKRKKLDHALVNAPAGELKSTLYAKFAEAGIGREVIVYATKPA